MNLQPLAVNQQAAYAALREYKAHRDTYDKRDWEIERIYRAISKGKLVISVNEAIVRGGTDALGRPRLAIMRADQRIVRCDPWDRENVTFMNDHGSKAAEWYFKIPWPNRLTIYRGYLQARLPRIPPQHRPAGDTLGKYHMLWEADWTDIPRDPCLLKRIGKDAWIVVAAWDLTEVELSVLRAHDTLRL
jgi:hypothetical protein